VCWPAPKSCSVTTGVCFSFGRETRLICRTGPPSTLTSAVPPSSLRAPIQVTEVPLNWNVAVAPATVDCMAPPPLQPNRASASTQSPGLRLTFASVSSNRPGLLATGGGLSAGGLLPLLAAGLAGLPPPPPPPPPPQETTSPASNRTPTYDTKRFMNHPSLGGNRRWESVGRQRVATRRGDMVRTTPGCAEGTALGASGQFWHPRPGSPPCEEIARKFANLTAAMFSNNQLRTHPERGCTLR